MARPYSHGELLKLRESPLVCKPANLPPVEEPIPDQNQNQNQNQRRTGNKSRNEEPLTNEGSTSRRPAFEAKAKSTNAPEDIILGPPKTAFASASGNRTANKTFDSPHRPSFGNHDDSSTKTDRNSLRDRHSKDGQRDSDHSRDPRAGSNQNRRSVKDDNGLWSGVRQQRSSAPDDGDRPYRKNGDRGHDKDGQAGRDNRPLRGFDNHRRDADREVDTENGTRRTGVGRGRNEPSWYRNEVSAAEVRPEDQEGMKPREWREKERKGTRGPDRDWTRGGKADLDPEWMEAPESEDTSGIHTQEDFERWKERMKSGNAAKSDAAIEQRKNHDRTSSGTGTGVSKAKVDTPLVVDSSVDGFFGLWNQPKKNEAATDVVDGVQLAATKTGAKVPKPSKFTGFFNPKPDPEPQKQNPSLPSFVPATDSSNADKEGFQRILSLLGQQQQPQHGKSVTPPRPQQQRDPTASPPAQASRGLENNDLYYLLGSKSPPANSDFPGKDSDFLLKLMQQPQQHRSDLDHGNSNGNSNGRRAGHDMIPGTLPHDTPQQNSSTQPPPGFFDELQIRDKLNPGTERRGPPPGFFDTNLPRQSSSGAPQQSPFPIGLPRPPGLDQIPPGYSQHVHPQRQNMVPPPGFQTPARGQNAFPPGLNPNDRLQFGMPVNGRGMPPPGFMHPAPPGFPVPFGQEGVPYGAFGDAGNFGRGFPPGQQRR